MQLPTLPLPPSCRSLSLTLGAIGMPLFCLGMPAAAYMLLKTNLKRCFSDKGFAASFGFLYKVGWREAVCVSGLVPAWLWRRRSRGSWS